MLVLYSVGVERSHRRENLKIVLMLCMFLFAGTFVFGKGLIGCTHRATITNPNEDRCLGAPGHGLV